MEQRFLISALTMLGGLGKGGFRRNDGNRVPTRSDLRAIGQRPGRGGVLTNLKAWVPWADLVRLCGVTGPRGYLSDLEFRCFPSAASHRAVRVWAGAASIGRRDLYGVQTPNAFPQASYRNSMSVSEAEGLPLSVEWGEHVVQMGPTWIRH